MTKISSLTGLIFALPSFASGTARVLDVGATFDVFITEDTPERVDALAMRGDWITVGRDFQNALASLRTQLSAEQAKAVDAEIERASVKVA